MIGSQLEAIPVAERMHDDEGPFGMSCWGGPETTTEQSLTGSPASIDGSLGHHEAVTVLTVVVDQLEFDQHETTRREIARVGDLDESLCR